MTGCRIIVLVDLHPLKVLNTKIIFFALLSPLLKHFRMITQHIGGHQPLSRILRPLGRDRPGLLVILFSPEDLLDQVRQIPSDGHVVHVGPEVGVEVLDVGRVLLEDEGAAGEQEGQAVGGDGTVEIQLVFVLEKNVLKL